MKTLQMRCYIGLILLFLSSICLAASGARQDLDVLKEMAYDFALGIAEDMDAERVDVSVSRLDRRLKLAVCTEGMEPFQSKGARFPGRGSVGIRCHGPSHWTVYATVHIKVYEPVVVAKHFLNKGQMIREKDVTLRSTNIARLGNGYYSDIEDVLGMELKRSMKPGKALTPAQIRQPKWVSRGEKVRLVVNTGGVNVTAMGKSLSDGGKGDRVTVKNLSSKKRVEGVVSGLGVVTIGL